MKKYSIEEIKNYLKSQDSYGDIFYYLTEENIDKANAPVFEAEENDEDVGVEYCKEYLKLRKSKE